MPTQRNDRLQTSYDANVKYIEAIKGEGTELSAADTTSYRSVVGGAPVPNSYATKYCFRCQQGVPISSDIG